MSGVPGQDLKTDPSNIILPSGKYVTTAVCVWHFLCLFSETHTSKHIYMIACFVMLARRIIAAYVTGPTANNYFRISSFGFRSHYEGIPCS